MTKCSIKVRRLDEPADCLEDDWLDFKEWPAMSDQQRCLVVEAAICFANSEGGPSCLVFGIERSARRTRREV
jgi:hypothetical protein